MRGHGHTHAQTTRCRVFVMVLAVHVFDWLNQTQRIMSNSAWQILFAEYHRTSWARTSPRLSLCVCVCVCLYATCSSSTRTENAILAVRPLSNMYPVQASQYNIFLIWYTHKMSLTFYSQHFLCIYYLYNSNLKHCILNIFFKNKKLCCSNWPHLLDLVNSCHHFEIILRKLPCSC